MHFLSLSYYLKKKVISLKQYVKVYDSDKSLNAII